MLQPVALMRRRSTVVPPTFDVRASSYDTEVDISAQPAVASVTFNSDGTVTKNADSGSTYSWATGAFVASEYSVMFQTSGGVLNSGTANVWQPLSSNRTAGVSRATIGNASWSGTIKIKRNSDGVIMDSAAVALNALVTS